jgi:hypothetical protein
MRSRNMSRCWMMSSRFHSRFGSSRRSQPSSAPKRWSGWYAEHLLPLASTSPRVLALDERGSSSAAVSCRSQTGKGLGWRRSSTAGPRVPRTIREPLCTRGITKRSSRRSTSSLAPIPGTKRGCSAGASVSALRGDRGPFRRGSADGRLGRGRGSAADAPPVGSNERAICDRHRRARSSNSFGLVWLRPERVARCDQRRPPAVARPRLRPGVRSTPFASSRPGQPRARPGQVEAGASAVLARLIARDPDDAESYRLRSTSHRR